MLGIVVGVAVDQRAVEANLLSRTDPATFFLLFGALNGKDRRGRVRIWVYLYACDVQAFIDRLERTYQR